MIKKSYSMTQIKSFIPYFVEYSETFPMLHIKSFTFNPFQENTYLIFDDTGEASIIDPGCHTAAERKELADFIQQKSLF